MGFRFDVGGLDPSFSDVYPHSGFESFSQITDVFQKGAPLEDVGAFVRYAFNPVMLLSDPKAPWEIRYLKNSGNLTWLAAIARWLPITMLLAGSFGWALDPSDYREGGVAEYTSYSVSDGGTFGSRASDDPWSTW